MHQPSRFSLLVCVVSISLASACSRQESSAPASAPLQVTALRVAKSDVPVTMEFIGQTKGSVDAEIRSRVEGVITAVHFQEGKEVREGQLLYSIDPAPYEARVAGALGKVAEAQTILVKAENDLKRIRPLVQMRAMSERDLDRATAQEGAAKGSLDAANAALDSARIELGYCEISSPIDGVIGITKAKVGEFVGKPPNPVVLNVVSKLDPINVLFSVGEKDYLYFARMRRAQEEQGQTADRRILRMVLADGSTYEEPGEISSIGREVDPATGTIRAEAAFPNPHKLIRPGQFAKIQSVVETMKGAILVPGRAVRELQGQYQVMVVKPDSTVESRNITLGRRIGDQQIVEKGLAENEVVVIDGLQRLKAGMRVSQKIEGES